MDGAVRAGKRAAAEVLDKLVSAAAAVPSCAEPCLLATTVRFLRAEVSLLAAASGHAPDRAEPPRRARHDDVPGTARARDLRPSVVRRLARGLRRGHRVHHRADQHGHQHRDLSRHPGAPAPRRSRPRRAAAGTLRVAAHPGGRRRGRRSEPRRSTGLDVEGHAVLFRTGWDRHWRTERYGDPEHPCLGTDATERLIAGGAVLVGIDSVNIDATSTGERPVHTALLAAGIPIVEHLTGLDAAAAVGRALHRHPAGGARPGHVPRPRLRQPALTAEVSLRCAPRVCVLALSPATSRRRRRPAPRAAGSPG